MRIHSPVNFVPTHIPHKNGSKNIDGFYLVVVDLDETVGMMSSVLRITDDRGRGVEITLSLDQTELVITDVFEAVSRPQPRTEEVRRFPARPTNVGARGIFRETHVVADLAWDPSGTFMVVTKPGYAVEMNARGNLVCPKCGRRHQLGNALRVERPCLCGQTLPALAIPFVIPPIIGTAPSTPL